MILRWTLFAVLLTVVGGAAAQDSPSVDLPVYPGGDTVMEMSVTQEELLPVLSAALTFGGDQVRGIAEAVGMDEIVSILGDVRRIQFLQLDVARGGVSTSEIASYYASKLPDGDWSRVYWTSSSKTGTIGVYVQPDARAIYGFRVRPKDIDGKTVQRIEAAQLDGKIDFDKLFSVAGRLFLPVMFGHAPELPRGAPQP